MRSKYRVINVKSAVFSGSVCPVTIPRGGDNRLLPKIGFKGFFLEGCCEYRFNTFESVQRFGLKNKTRGSSEIKPILSGGSVTVVLVHWNMVIYEGTDGYQIR